MKFVRTPLFLTIVLVSVMIVSLIIIKNDKSVNNIDLSHNNLEEESKPNQSKLLDTSDKRISEKIDEKEQKIVETTSKQNPSVAKNPRVLLPGAGKKVIATFPIDPEAAPRAKKVVAIPRIKEDGTAEEKIAAVFADATLDMRNPADRAQAIRRIKKIEDEERVRVAKKAKSKGLPIHLKKKNGGGSDLIGFDGDEPIYIETKNVNSAISSHADVTWETPYGLDGSGITIGVWDEAGGRATHAEFNTGSGSRLTNMNGTERSPHAMHVAGTVGATGVNSSARGMANAVEINSYDWFSDTSEMMTVAATSDNQLATRISLSNHSYGPADGWASPRNGNPWTWTGTGSDQNASDWQFGQYGFSARNVDSVAYTSPFYLQFWAAGNDNNDRPRAGDDMRLSRSTTAELIAYDPAVHPPGDGDYRSGFETISGDGTAKNIVTVGAVSDGVRNGIRDISRATLASFSSTGPTDDGRIKPDLVANGVSLRSTGITSDTNYYSSSGTSMASPSACGSAGLIVDQYNRLYNKAMRSSTLKALLIHTADDRGNPGPDYRYGWGLVNVKRAVDIVRSQHATPATPYISDKTVSNINNTDTTAFLWDGTSPIKASVAWTDPAGIRITGNDSRTSVLVNDLDLKLIAPDGTEYFPYVMPYVGTWTVASMSENATMGVDNGATNNRDNVEQVYIANPGQIGEWKAVITYKGNLTNNSQDFGLIISGATDLPNSVLVESPNGGESFISQNTFNITWRANVVGNIRIELYKGGVFYRVLAANQTNNGIYSWTVANNIEVGNDYTLRISSSDNPEYEDFSDANFSISNEPTLADGLDTIGVEWRSGGNANWFYQTEVSSGDNDAAQSGAINDSQTSSMEATFTGPGVLTFDWRVSSEVNYDFLRLYLDNNEQGGNLARISGEVDWTKKTLNIPAGSHVVKWSYTKDGSVANGSDAAWVDAVSYIPENPPNYVEWSGGSDHTADDNNDGVSNGMAWALGAENPMVDASNLMPTLAVIGDDFVYTHRRNDAVLVDNTANLYCQYDTDLISWTNAVAGEDITITTIDDGYRTGVDKVEVRIKLSIASDGRLFGRLKLDINPP